MANAVETLLMFVSSKSCSVVGVCFKQVMLSCWELAPEECPYLAPGKMSFSPNEPSGRSCPGTGRGFRVRPEAAEAWFFAWAWPSPPRPINTRKLNKAEKIYIKTSAWNPSALVGCFCLRILSIFVDQTGSSPWTHRHNSPSKPPFSGFDQRDYPSPIQG